MALFVLSIFCISVYFITKKQTKYDAVLKIRKWGICFIICILISYAFTNIQNNEYENSIKTMKNSQSYIGVIISNPIQKEYYTRYLLKLTKANEKEVNITVYLQIKGKNNFKYGEEISFTGQYEEPDTARNDKGFKHKQYLKSNRNYR